RLIEHRSRETPENSIKFSNVSQEEISRWREGRPSPPLRYALSFWSDLAKWMMSLNEVGTVSFEEDAEGFPTRITTEFPLFTARFEVRKKDLLSLIPSLDTVNSQLKVFPAIDEKIEKISFDPHKTVLRLEHAYIKPSEHPQQARLLGDWAYLP